MENSKDGQEPVLMLYVGIFAGVCIIIMGVGMVMGMLLERKLNLSLPILLGGGLTVCGIFIHKCKRAFTISEAVQITIGCFIIDAAIQFGLIAISGSGITGMFAMPWYLWLIPAVRLVGLFFIFAHLSRMIFKFAVFNK